MGDQNHRVSRRTVFKGPSTAAVAGLAGCAAPAERKTIEFTADADPGIYPLHCHKVDHVTNDGVYPGGMATAIVYESAMDTDQFGAVIEKAGYGG